MTVENLTSRGPVAGLTISAHGTPDASVDVAAGLGCYDGQGVAIGAVTNVDILTGNPADQVQHRYDWLVFSSAGAVSVVVGTLGGPGPDYSLLGSSAPIGYVFVDAGVTAVVQSAITLLPYTSFVQPANCLFYTYGGGDAADADPGTGIFTTDGHLLGTVTKIYVNYNSLAGEAERWLTQSPPFYLRLWSKKSGAASYVIYKVTAVAKHTNYDTLTVTLVDEGGLRGTVGAPGGWTVATILSTDAGDTIFERNFLPAPPTTWTINNKTGNTARSSTTSLTADPDMQFAVAANTTYIIRGTVRFDSSSATPGFKFDFDGPSSPTRVAVAIWDVVDSLAVESALDTAHSITGTTFTVVHFEIILENGANAGTFSFRWAQDTSNGTAVNVRPGSYLEYLVS